MAATVPSKAGTREWAGLAVLGLPTLLLAMDNSVLFLALPQLTEDLGPSSTQMLWIMDIYGFFIAGFLITMGSLGDRIGRRRLLLAGSLAFAVASVLAAYSTSAEMLIVTRALLGIAGATLMPSTLSLIRTMFTDAEQRTTAIGAWMGCFIIGVVSGPIIGGALLEYFWWGSVFLIGVPVMLVLLVLGPILLPEFRDAEAGRLDLTSAVLSLIAVLPLIYALKEIANHGFAWVPVLWVPAGLIAGTLFVWRQRRLADPMVDVTLFTSRAFSASLIVMTLGMSAMGGTYFFYTQYMQLVEGLSPFRTGLWLLPAAGMMIVGAAVIPVLARQIRPGYLIGAGLLISAAGLLLLTRMEPDSSLGVLVVGLLIVMAGLTPILILGTDMIVGIAPPNKAGSASALSETSGEFGIALGLAGFGSAGTAVYRDELNSTLPDGVPAGAVEGIRDTLAAALAIAEELPGNLGVEVAGAARAAFVSGMNVGAATTAAVVAVTAVLATVLLRRVPLVAELSHEDTTAEAAGAAETLNTATELYVADPAD